MTPRFRRLAGPRFPVILAITIAAAARLIVPPVEERLTGDSPRPTEPPRLTAVDDRSVTFLRSGPPPAD